VDGKSKRESANTRSFAGVEPAAELKTKELHGEAPSGETTVQAISVDAAIQDWLRFRETNGLGNDKPKLMGGKLLTWCKANSATFLHQLTSDKVIHFRNSLPYKTKTSSSLKIHWAIICNFFGWAHGIGLVPKNPVPNTRVHPQFKIRFKKPEVVPPTTDENDRAFPQTPRMAVDMCTFYHPCWRTSFSARSQSCSSWPGSRPRLSYSSYARSLILLSDGTASGIIANLPGELFEGTTTGAFGCLLALGSNMGVLRMPH
jgi:hypothetical protein